MVDGCMTFVGLASGHGSDGIIHHDVFDAGGGQSILHSLLGRSSENDSAHVTARPFRRG